ncbi:uncharacterized protein LOC111322549 [Stylophora pistillata]|uniref:uncharacterized protein LOC111322549 n=1 Tax=Stylophora pistillata TaxID=50429 RepID=UPI000C053B91|nr:uncharacterized protein LOC111322549 [Stylophora pistillata]
MARFLLLLGVITSVFCQDAMAVQFSKQQESQLRNLLKEEAGSFRKGMQMMCPKSPGQWQRLNVTNACFSAKDKKHGSFIIPLEGFVVALKVVHTSGRVTCEKDRCHANHGQGSFYSKWGCSASHPYIGSTPLGTFITLPSKQVIFPREKFIRDKALSAWYALPGFDPESPFIVFHDFSNPEYFPRGQVLQLWYGEVLKDVSVKDNHGETCAEVYAWYL